jgi:hypothetical protein
MAVDQHVMRTQGRVVDGPERGCCEEFLIVPVLNETRSGVFSRPPFRRALPTRA